MILKICWCLDIRCCGVQLYDLLQQCFINVALIFALLFRAAAPSEKRNRNYHWDGLNLTIHTNVHVLIEEVQQ